LDFKAIGKQVEQHRKAQHISQEQMASELNISRATISAFENGKSADLGLKKAIKIINYLGYELTLKPSSPFPTFEELKDEQ
jgi:transcriptional regulator with XRE-family HTH domain